MDAQPSTNQVVDHLFRNQSGKMIAVLTRIFGIHNLELAEDVVQEAFETAVHTWKFGQLPVNPEAWLMTTARNRAIDIIRRQQLEKKYSFHSNGFADAYTTKAIDDFFLEEEIADSQLQMIFACCHPSLKEEDQLALTLKTVSGFGIREISRALMLPEAAVQKRVHRAKQFLKENQIRLSIPSGTALEERLDTVYTILYLLFNEGYNASKADELIRKDLCAEAMRLCLLLIEHKNGNRPAGFALLALMCFQASRFDSRMDATDSIILLKDQDRNKWNRDLINRGYYYINKASSGSTFTVYHLEAAIAAEHCIPKNFEDTNWTRLLDLYDLLLIEKSGPMVILNRAVVLAKLGRSKEAIDDILSINRIGSFLETHYIFSAVLGELYKIDGNPHEALRYFEKAKALTSSIAEKKLLQVKIDSTRN
jgi:RNA polymerase sigma factor (sigma-70 family)